MNANNSRGEDVPVVPIFLEYLQVIMHTYLYHRHIYPLESFELKKKYSIPIHVCTHLEVADYIVKITEAIGRVLENDSFEQVEIHIKIEDKLAERLLIKLPHLEVIKENEISASLMFKLQEKLRCSLIVFAEKLNALYPLTSSNQTITDENHDNLSPNTPKNKPTSHLPTWSVAMVTSMDAHLRVLQQQQLNANLFWMAEEDDEYAGNKTINTNHNIINDDYFQDNYNPDSNKDSDILRVSNNNMNSYNSNNDDLMAEEVYKEILLTSVHSKHLKIKILIEGNEES